MPNLATDILRNEKRKCTFWKVSAFVILAVTVVEFIAIIF